MQAVYHERLESVRTILRQEGVDAFILSVNDAFFSEYPPAHYKRLEWLTGFDGSAGTVIILQNTAAFFTDGRYTLQAAEQVNPKDYQHFNSSDTSPLDWLMEHGSESQRTSSTAQGAAQSGGGSAAVGGQAPQSKITLGIDPWLFSLSQHRKWGQKLPELQWKFLSENSIDKLWEDRPPLSDRTAFHYPVKYAGKSSEQKRKELAESLQKKGVDATFLTVPESVCWLLNIRGYDVAHTPVLLCRALVGAEGNYQLFADAEKIENTTDMDSALRNLSGKKILIDPSQTPVALAEKLKQAGAVLVEGEDPCILPKACKNPIELENIRKAHHVDGLALSQFLEWVDKTKDTLTEISASDKLEEFRRESDDLLDLSFPTISGFGANGAIVHYRATENSSKVFEKENLYLVDSGGQYWGGTTDVTRTVYYGENPTDEMREHYTRVLKGHIALGQAVFPIGTTGRQLDALARQHLWQAGLDYDHGTGHGVGCCLGVHEGPQRISKLGSDTPLQIGMILSNEPGYYRTGHYGIRLENLVEVVAAEQSGFLKFNNLTCAPFDKRLLKKDLLTASEIAWWNTYHQWVLQTHLPHWEGNKEWLESFCAAL